ncbi:chorismate--pyruvate lyase, partial [Acinetobacter baumannii]
PEGWTRQSCYTWHGCKFIVQETFLPAFEAFLYQQHDKELL